MASALYRARQFLRGFRTTFTVDEVASVHALLTEEERALFFGMLPRDRRHSLDMVHWLRAHAAPSDEVLAAALLHDIGKGQLWVWDRVAFVLLGAVGHELRDRLAVEGGGRFRDAWPPPKGRTAARPLSRCSRHSPVPEWWRGLNQTSPRA